MKVQVTVLVMALAFSVLPDACSVHSENGSGRGGVAGNGVGAGEGGSRSMGSGGSSNGGAGGGGSCSSVTPCGGNVVGTWTVTSACLNVGGEIDMTVFGTGCPTAPVTGSLQVTGTWTGNADGTYSDNTTTTGTEQITLAKSCLVISSAPVTCDGMGRLLTSLGYASVVCANAADGGCSCTATVQQSGGLGSLSVDPQTSGGYTTADDILTTDGGAQYSYCVSGNEMTWTPQTTKPATKGTVVLQKGGSSGAGGTSDSGGGQGGSGGTRDAGRDASAGGAGGQDGGSGGTRDAAAGAGGARDAGSTGGSTGPCDIYRSGGTPCVAAHSTIRALFGAYNGKLYQVRNSAGTTMDIATQAAGGVANAAAQDAFCSGTTCVITIIYDQSGTGNDLWYQGAGGKFGGVDQPARATGESITVRGNKAYSLFIAPGNSYWLDGSRTGIPTGSQPEGMYMVTSGKHFNAGCCFDYGNSELDRKADGAGTMDAINFSTTSAWGTGVGNGPWVLADLEFGLFAQNNQNKNLNNPIQTSTFVTAVLKNNGTTEFAIKGGDATTGSLGTYYKGGLPAGWSPMKKQGAMVLGSGGDCCATNTNQSDGTFYEGCLVTGYPSDATEDAVQANVVGAGYGR